MKSAIASRPNIWLGGTALAFVAGCLYESTQISVSPSGSDPGPAVYPQLILGLIAFCAVAIMASRPEAEGEQQARSWKIVLGVFGSLVAYVFCLQFIGYIVSTSIFLVLTLILAGERRWGVAALYAAGLSLGLYFIFSTYLSVSLPIGLVEEILQ